MTQLVELPINAKPYQNVDDFLLDIFTDELVDGYIDELGNKTKRPGLNKFTDIASFKKIDGLYWWPVKEIVIGVSEGKIYKSDNVGTITNITGDELESSGRVAFTDNGTTLVMANGGRMVYTDGTANTQFIADADAPIKVTHVAFLDQWILCNEVDTAKFYYADFTAAPTTWLAVNVFSAEAYPDNLLSLYVVGRTIILGGNISTEFWYNDGITPFSRIQGTTTNRGVMGHYATGIANGSVYFFDDRRRLVRFDGTEPVILSTPFDRTIQEFGTVDDILMDYITPFGKHFLIMTFPTENRTLFYDLIGDYWGEWSFFDKGTNERDRYLMNSYCYAATWNKHLVGRYNNSQIYEILRTDYDDDGEDIFFLVRTGHIDHGAPGRKKRSYRLNLRLKVGVGLANNTKPYLKIRWKDNGRNYWSNYRYVSLKVSGDTAFVIDVYTLGEYTTRQWEFSMNDQVPFSIGKAVEEIDINEF
jgi:hypothetical protein